MAAKSYVQEWLDAQKRTHPPQPLVPDSTFTQQVGANAQPYNTALAQLPGNLASAGANYGYGYTHKPGQIDPTTGLLGAPDVQVGGIDPSNPYSRAALLQRSFHDTQRGNTTSMAARGQLYSGSLQNAQNSAQRNYNQAESENRAGFQDLIRGFVNNLGGLSADRIVNDATATGGLTERSINPATGLPFVQVRTNPDPAPPAFFKPLGLPKPKKRKT